MRPLLTAGLVTLSLLSGLAGETLQGHADADGKTLWFDGSALPIEGRAFTDTEAYYDRLPARAQATVPPSVWNLSHHSAGMVLRFVTDASTLKVRWILRNKDLAKPHMPATGVSGVDLYQRTAKGWRFVKNGRPTDITNAVETVLAPDTETLLYLPPYNGVAALEVGIPAGRTLQAAPPRPSGITKPIVFYGTSITQGACASRPGTAFTAIAGRRLDAPVVNLGFAGNGKMELSLCDLVSEIDASVYVLDCLWNMSPGLLGERAEPFVRALRKKRPDTPILLAEDCNAFGRAPTEKAKVLLALYQKLKAEDPAKWADLHYLEAKEMLGHDTEATVDGCHPNDLGMMRQAAAFADAIGKLLHP